LVKAVFDFPTAPFQQLAETVRLATVEAAARENVRGLVFTFVYASPDDDPFIQRVIDVVERPVRASRSTTRRSARTPWPGASRYTSGCPYARDGDGRPPAC